MDRNSTTLPKVLALNDTDAANQDAQPLINTGEENIKFLGSEKILVPKKKKKPKKNPCVENLKTAGFVIVGLLTFVYSIGELGVAIYLNSLALLSDGFHNLSDVVSLIIAIWANQAAKKLNSEKYSYGWGRAEILGALTNACFLLSLSLYIVLEAIPKIIKPEEMESGLYFIIVAAAGLGVNLFGTIVFAITGQHGHSHAGGGGHGHSHGGKKDKHKENDHGHDHKEHGHDHKDKKEKKQETSDSDEEHAHNLSDLENSINSDTSTEHEDDHGHDHKEHGHDHKEHGHDHKDKKDKKKKHDHDYHDSHNKGCFSSFDLNTFAILIHYAGDALSSLFILAAGFILKYEGTHQWTEYVDPVSSLLIVLLILITTLPLVKRCGTILLQSAPKDFDHKSLKKEISEVDGIVSTHDNHIWQLVDGMLISSIHVIVVEGTDFNKIAKKLKKILHRHGIHSSSIQPEFVPKEAYAVNEACVQNCVPECEEDWCCKKTAEVDK